MKVRDNFRGSRDVTWTRSVHSKRGEYLKGRIQRNYRKQKEEKLILMTPPETASIILSDICICIYTYVCTYIYIYSDEHIYAYCLHIFYFVANSNEKYEAEEV